MNILGAVSVWLFHFILFQIMIWEIKYTFSWMMQNNLRCFEILKLRRQQIFLYFRWYFERCIDNLLINVYVLENNERGISLMSAIIVVEYTFICLKEFLLLTQMQPKVKMILPSFNLKRRYLTDQIFRKSNSTRTAIILRTVQYAKRKDGAVQAIVNSISIQLMKCIWCYWSRLKEHFLSTVIISFTNYRWTRERRSAHCRPSYIWFRRVWWSIRYDVHSVCWCLQSKQRDMFCKRFWFITFYKCTKSISFVRVSRSMFCQEFYVYIKIDQIDTV